MCNENNPCEKCEHKNKFFPDSVLSMCKKNNLFDKNVCGFVNPKAMQGIFLGVCDKVNHPLVFIQRKNTNCTLERTSEGVGNDCKKIYGQKNELCKNCLTGKEFFNDYYRLESDLFYTSLSGICKYVRKENNDGNSCGFRDCLLSDSYAAAYFLAKDTLPQDRKTYFDGLHKSNTKQERDYLQYTCKRTYFTELAIPVILEGKTVGVIIFGQMLKAENKTQHKEFLEEFKSEHSDNEDLMKESTTFSKTVYTKEAFENKIKECISAVEDLEKQLQELLSLYRKWYIDITGSELLKDFNKIEFEPPSLIRGIVSTEMAENNFTEFKKSLRELTASLCEKMSIPKMICFAPDILQNAINNPDYLYKINENGSIDKNENKLNLKIYQTLCSSCKGKITDQEHIKELVSNLNINNSEDLTYLLYLSVGDNKNVMPIAILFGYEKEKETVILKELDPLIERTKDPVYVVSSSIVNKYMELEQRRFIQVMRHELGQSYAGYLCLLDGFEKELIKSIGDMERFANSILVSKTAEKTNTVVDNCIKNSRAFSHIAMLRINSSRYVGGVQIPKKEMFYPYGTFLFKWNYIFTDTQKEKYLRFKMPVGNVYSNPTNYPLMYADPNMIEQVAFNLTNNAMKYSHIGSAVTLDCYAKDNNYILEVVNYAMPMPKNELKQIFNYGYSGKNHHSGGSGLGLYISHEIAKRHNGTLDVNQEIVSDFNVPLLQLYDRDLPEKFFSEELYREVQLEINRLKQKNEKEDITLWSQIIGNPIPQNPFTPLYLINNIKTKTARIKFTLSIPLKTEENEDDKK